MALHVFTTNNHEKVREVSNEGADWMFPQIQKIKETSVPFTINKILQFCIVKVGGFKRSDALGTLFFLGYAYDMVMNTTLDFLSAITRGVWYF